MSWEKRLSASVSSKKLSEKLLTIQGTAMREQENIVMRIGLEKANDLCARLFESWCERRAVLPLAYLMRSWPFIDSMLSRDNYLAESLRELVWGGQDALQVQEIELIHSLIAILTEQRSFAECCVDTIDLALPIKRTQFKS